MDVGQRETDGAEGLAPLLAQLPPPCLRWAGLGTNPPHRALPVLADFPIWLLPVPQAVGCTPPDHQHPCTLQQQPKGFSPNPLCVPWGREHPAQRDPGHPHPLSMGTAVLGPGSPVGHVSLCCRCCLHVPVWRGAGLPHPFTQTFKLPSEIAPCNLLAQRCKGPGRREQIPGQGIRKKQLLPVHAKTHACVLGVRGGGCPGELAASLPSHSTIPREKHRCKEEGEAGAESPRLRPQLQEGPRLQPQLQEGPSRYGGMWFGVRIPAGGSPAGK